MGEKWRGGDMTHFGGGQKVNLLKKEVEKHKADDNLIIMFTDRSVKVCVYRHCDESTLTYFIFD